jgi:4-hydroxybenzoate polyprenyltransferase
MDESGIMKDYRANGLVVGSSERRSIQKKQPGSCAWTSFIKCILDFDSLDQNFLHSTP